jgi:glycosidase
VFLSFTFQKGMKVIMDKIHNHVGTHHWFIKDLPTSDWVHDQGKVGNTNYRTDTLMDPYASKSDLNATVKGWFVDSKQVLMLEHSIQFPTDRL